MIIISGSQIQVHYRAKLDQ